MDKQTQPPVSAKNNTKKLDLEKTTIKSFKIKSQVRAGVDPGTGHTCPKLSCNVANCQV
jgi:hypothetical protein